MSFFSDVGNFLKRATTPPSSFNKTVVGKFIVNPVRKGIRYVGAAHAAPFLTAGQEKQAFGLTSRESKNVEVLAKVERGIIAAGAALLGGATVYNWGWGAAAPVMTPQVAGTSKLYLGYGEQGASPYAHAAATLDGGLDLATASEIGGSAAVAASGGSQAATAAAGASGGILGGLTGVVKSVAGPVLTAFGLSKLLGGGSGGGGLASGGLEAGGTSVNIGDTGAGAGGPGMGTQGYFPGYLPGVQPGQSALADTVAPVVAAVGGFPGLLLIGAAVGVWWYFRKKK